MSSERYVANGTVKFGIYDADGSLVSHSGFGEVGRVLANYCWWYHNDTAKTIRDWEAGSAFGDYSYFFLNEEDEEILLAAIEAKECSEDVWVEEKTLLEQSKRNSL